MIGPNNIYDISKLGEFNFNLKENLPDKKYILFGGAFSNTRKNYALLKAAIDKLRSTLNTKCLVNGILYIEHDGKLYNAQGGGVR